MRAVPPRPAVPPVLQPDRPPARSGRLAVRGGHELAWYEWGAPEGEPVLLLHGGPGSGCGTLLARFFDPLRWRVIGFDQRGCARSHPAGGTAANTTGDLLDDIRALRRDRGVPRCRVVGGSWGATLALLHAADQPEAVSGLLLRGVFLARRSDVDRFFDTAGQGGPDAWAPWRDRAGAEGVDLATVLDRVLNHEADAAAQDRLVETWWRWEQRLDGIDAGPVAADTRPALLQRYRVQAHYLRHGCFLDEVPLLDRLAAVPAVPTLLLHGTHDRICPVDGARRVHAGLPASTLREVAGAGHAPTHPAMAAAMLAALHDAPAIEGAPR